MARKRTKRPACPNCDLPLRDEDNYCARCGQENHTHKLPLRYFFVELLGGMLNFDTKLVRTLRDLFAPPGLATRNFNENRRARYVPPLRLYLFTSLVFFLVAAWLPERPSEPRNEENDLRFTAGSDTIDDALTAMAEAGMLTDAVIDSVMRSQGEEPSLITRKLVRAAIEQNAGGAASATFNERIKANFANALFALLPVFAIILKLVCLRQKRFFTEHLVFAVHYHTVFFILLLIAALIEWPFSANGTDASVVTGITVLLGIALLPWMMRTAYQRPWWKTIVKAMIVVVLYGACLGSAVALTAIGTALVE
jgi:hypothetical protein